MDLAGNRLSGPIPTEWGPSSDYTEWGPSSEFTEWESSSLPTEGVKGWSDVRVFGPQSGWQLPLSPSSAFVGPALCMLSFLSICLPPSPLLYAPPGKGSLHSQG